MRAYVGVRQHSLTRCFALGAVAQPVRAGDYESPARASRLGQMLPGIAKSRAKLSHSRDSYSSPLDNVTRTRHYGYMTNREALEAKIASQSTDRLLEMLDLTDQSTEGRALTNHEHIVSMAIISEIEGRHDLDAAMDAIFATDFAGTYTEALRLAISAEVVAA